MLILHRICRSIVLMKCGHDFRPQWLSLDHLLCIYIFQWLPDFTWLHWLYLRRSGECAHTHTHTCLWKPQGVCSSYASVESVQLSVCFSPPYGGLCLSANRICFASVKPFLNFVFTKPQLYFLFAAVVKIGFFHFTPRFFVFLLCCPAILAHCGHQLAAPCVYIHVCSPAHLLSG